MISHLTEGNTINIILSGTLAIDLMYMWIYFHWSVGSDPLIDVSETHNW